MSGNESAVTVTALGVAVEEAAADQRHAADGIIAGSMAKAAREGTGGAAPMTTAMWPHIDVMPSAATPL